MYRAVLSGLLLAGGAAVIFSWGRAESPIKADEVVVFFPTAAVAPADGSDWEIDVHGWIFEPEEDSIWRAFVIEGASAFPGITREDLENPLLVRRMRSFLADNERGKQLTIRLAGKTYPLAESGANGHCRTTIRVPGADVERARTERGWLPFEAVTREDDTRSFTGRVRLVDSAGLSVISDIDDTVKVSNVTDKSALIKKTFLEEFTAVEGMPELYRRLEQNGAVFHYVSSSPWQLYEDLAGLFGRAGLPGGSFHLKTFRIKDSSFLDLFASAEKTKPSVIEPLIVRFPARRFVLIGDSGEKDPEVYGAIARQHPGRIARILIRKAPGGDHHPERFEAAFRDLPPELWQVFESPEEVTGF